MALNGANEHASELDEYSVPRETQKILHDGILNNTLIAQTLPEEIGECAQRVEFVGSDKPSIPINWRFAESISALKGLEASMINVLLRRKYSVEPQKAVINTSVYHPNLIYPY
jgi:hypothetical protein